MHSPEIAARVDDPVANALVAHLLLDEGISVSKQLHGQLVVGRLQKGQDLILQVRRRGRLLLVLEVIHVVGSGRELFFGSSVQARLIPEELHLDVVLIVDLRAQVVAVHRVGVRLQGYSDGRVGAVGARR